MVLRVSHSGWSVAEGRYSFERKKTTHVTQKGTPSLFSAPVWPPASPLSGYPPKEGWGQGPLAGPPAGASHLWKGSVSDPGYFSQGGYTDNPRKPLTGVRKVSPRATCHWHSIPRPLCLQCIRN